MKTLVAFVRNFKVPSKYDQLQSDVERNRCLEVIRIHYKDNPYGFEACATNIISKMDSNFVDFSLTRPWRDGGRDACSMSAGSRENPLMKTGNFNAFFREKCLTKNRFFSMSRVTVF